MFTASCKDNTGLDTLAWNRRGSQTETKN